MAIYDPNQEDIIKNEILNKSGQDAVDAYYYLMRVSKNNNLSNRDRMIIGYEIADWYNTGFKTKNWDTLLNEQFNKIGQGTGYDMPASMADDYNKLTSVTKAWQDKGGAFNQPTTTTTPTTTTLTGWDKFYNDNKDAFQKAGIVSNLWNPDSAYQKAKKAYEVNPNNTNPDFNNQFLTNVIQTGKLPDGTLLSTPATEQVNNENLSPQEIAQKMRVAYEKSMQNIAQNPNKENIVQKYNIGDFKGSLRGNGTSIGNDNIGGLVNNAIASNISNTVSQPVLTPMTTGSGFSIPVMQKELDPNALPTGAGGNEFSNIPSKFWSQNITVMGQPYHWNGTQYNKTETVSPTQTTINTTPTLTPNISTPMATTNIQRVQKEIDPNALPTGSSGTEFSNVPTKYWTMKITVNGKPYHWNGTQYNPDVSTVLSQPTVNSFQTYGPGGTGLTSVPTQKTTDTIIVNGKKYAWMGNSYSIIPGQ